jgi:hypothetical protein
MLIDGNVIRQTNGNSRALAVAVRGPSAPLANSLGANTVVSDFTITNNDIVPGAPTDPSFTSGAIVVEADNQTLSDNKSPTVRADIRGNSVPSSTVNGEFLPQQLQFYEYTSAGSHGIGQLVDTPPASADATAQLASTNTGSAAANSGNPNGVSLIAGPINTPP